MPKHPTLYFTVLVFIVVILFAVFRPKFYTEPIPAYDEIKSSIQEKLESSPSAKVEHLVTQTSKGFSPQTITVKLGETVVWVNEDKVTHNVSSALHPTHQAYPPLNLGDYEATQKMSITIPTPGTYKYHDHLYPNLTGTIIVE